MEGYKKTEGRTITIYDIAKEAGVSASTVSRVLTNNANVRTEKRERVQSLIEKYDFKPNAMARSLVDTRSRVIGIIAADIKNPFYADIFVACENAAQKMGYTVLLGNFMSNMKQEIRQLEMLWEKRVDVIIQFGGRVDDLVSNKDYVERVKRLTHTIPMVITGKLDGTDCYQVLIDSQKAVELLLEHLFSLGHRKIAMVGGRMDVISTNEKYGQYLEFLEKHGIDFQKEFIVEGSYDYETGYQGMNRLFDSRSIPTAVIAINDFAAAGVVRSIIEHDLKIPQDISVVSYDNTYIADLLTPRLTSVDYDYAAFGRILVNTALAAVEERKMPKVQYVVPKLVIRESSGPAPL